MYITITNIKGAKSVDIAMIETRDINEIKGLWQGLTKLHAEKSCFFSDEFANMNFERRMEQLIAKVGDGEIKIILLLDNEKAQRKIGYCVSSYFNHEGEIDSLYVDEHYRGYHLGEKLMENVLDWLNGKEPKLIKLNVAHGNEEVFSFYEKFGFYPRTYTLLKKTQ
jgi:ribosomal protein S18 acetylase RimI-like enzyme